MEEAARAEEEAAKAAEPEGEEWLEELLEEEPETAEAAGEPEGPEQAEAVAAPEVDAEGGTPDSGEVPAPPADGEPEDTERS